MENSAVTNNQTIVLSLPPISEKRIKEFPKNEGISVLSNKDVLLIEIEENYSDFKYYLTNLDLTSLIVKKNNEVNKNNLGDIEMLVLNKYLGRIELIREEGIKLLEDGVSPPNEWVLNMSKKLILELSEFEITSYNIEPSYDEGIAFVFKNNSQKMYLEIYNEGQIGYIIEDYQKKVIIENQDVKSIFEAKNRIRKFVA